MNIKYYFLLFIYCVTFSLPALAKPQDPNLQTRLDNLSQQLERKRLEHNIPGMAIAIVKDDRVIYSKGFGVSNLEKKTPVTPQTLFGIGSNTKAFTTTMIGILVEQGKMNWDDPVTKYLPELNFSPKNTVDAITIRDMVTHRTGFTRFNMLYANDKRTINEVLSDATKAKPWVGFRQHFIYNNVMFTGAGAAAAKVMDSDWDSLLNKLLLQPLEMDSTTSLLEQAFKNPEFSQGYRWVKEIGKHKPVTLRNVSNIAPSAAINSNIIDMAKWLRLQMSEGSVDGRQIISSEQLKKITTPQITIDGSTTYGLGWVLSDWRSKKLIAHSGSIKGHSSFVAFLPQENLGFVLLTNLTNTSLLKESGPIVWQNLLDQPKSKTNNEIGDRVDSTNQVQNYEQYIGKYNANFFSFKDAKFSFQIHQNKLIVDIPGERAYELDTPDKEGKFYLKRNSKIAFSFQKNKAGSITAMVMHKKGMAFEMPRDGAQYDQEISTEKLNKYLGSYPSDLFNGNLSVKIQNNRLALDIPNKLVAELHQPDPNGHWRFRVKPIMSVTFETSDSGQIVALNIFKSGKKLGRSVRSDDRSQNVLPTLSELSKLRNSQQQKAALIAASGFKMTGKVKMPQSAVSGTINTHIQHDDYSTQMLDFGAYGQIKYTLEKEFALTEMSFDDSIQHHGKYFEQLRRLHPMAMLDWPQYFNKTQIIAASQLHKKKVYEVELTSDNLPLIKAYVDAESGDILKLKFNMLLVDYGKIPMTYFFDDYRTIEGVRFPFKVSIEDSFMGETIMVWDSIVSESSTQQSAAN